MKKSVKTLKDIYGGYITPDFVEGLMRTSKEARIRARHNLDDLTKKSSTDNAIGVCVEAEQFWRLLEEECRRWLDGNKVI